MSDPKTHPQLEIGWSVGLLPAKSVPTPLKNTVCCLSFY